MYLINISSILFPKHRLHKPAARASILRMKAEGVFPWSPGAEFACSR